MFNLYLGLLAEQWSYCPTQQKKQNQTLTLKFKSIA